jgi:hypothetical protein
MPAKKQLSPRRDLTGKIFGRLTVLSFSHYVEKTNRRQDFWSTKCECGKEKPVLGNSLVSGGTTSCGCLLKEHYAKLPEKTRMRNLLPKGESNFNSIFAEYKNRSKRKKLKFSLNIEEFRQFVTSNCEYCNSPPMNTYKRARSNEGFTYNGIDRLDSDKGYIKSNCVTACEICNKAKRDLTLEEFISWIKRISQSTSWKKLIKV